MTADKSNNPSEDSPDIDALQKRIRELKAKIALDLQKSKEIKEFLDITDNDIERGLREDELSDVAKQLFSEYDEKSDELKSKKAQEQKTPKTRAPTAKRKNIKRI